MTRFDRKWVLFLLVPILCLASWGHSDADQKARVTVRLIEGSVAGDKVDPRLPDIRAKLSSFRFSSYRLMNTQTLELSQGEGKSKSISGSLNVKITYMGKEKNYARFALEVSHGNSRPRRTTFRLVRGGEFFYAISSKGERGLFLSIRASF
jgi:hypothetical protein